MRKILIFIFLNIFYLSTYASDNPITNMVNDGIGKGINEASILGGEDFKLTILIFTIIIASIYGLFIMFKKN